MKNIIDTLTKKVRGAVITPSDPDYDKARAIHNGMHDRRPRAVIQCVDSADVLAAVAAGRDGGFELAIRGGGHSVPGFGTLDGGLVIDLSKMNGVRVDPVRKVARVGGGSTWGDVDHATYPFGLAVPGGIISTTGVGGLTLGGGIGYLTRSVGLSIDSLLSADVVLADGPQVTAVVITRTKICFGPCAAAAAISASSPALSFTSTRSATSWAVRYSTRSTMPGQSWNATANSLPRRRNSSAAFSAGRSLLRCRSSPRTGTEICSVYSSLAGTVHTRRPSVYRPLRDVAEVKADGVVVMPFPALNSAFDELAPKGMQYYWKADFVTELTDEAIAAHVEHGKKTPHMSSSMHLHPINGAAQRVGAAETAFGHRDKSFAPVIAGIWSDPADNEANIKWVKDYYAAIHPHSGSDGGYINFMSGDDATTVRCKLWRQLRAACSREGRLRPGQPLPRQPEHRPSEEELRI